MYICSLKTYFVFGIFHMNGQITIFTYTYTHIQLQLYKQRIIHIHLHTQLHLNQYIVLSLSNYYECSIFRPFLTMEVELSTYIRAFI